MTGIVYNCFTSLIVVINLLNGEYSGPASGYDWVAFGILENPAIDIALQVDFAPLTL